MNFLAGFVLVFFLLGLNSVAIDAFQMGKKILTAKSIVKSSPALRMSATDDKNYVAIGAAGVVANVVCDYSLFVLKTTGCGLPAGPFGLIGAAEGISYLIVVGIFLWSLITKVKTGTGNVVVYYSVIN